jgi:hypothetical protein
MSVKMKMTVEKFSVGVFDVCRKISWRDNKLKKHFSLFLSNSQIRLFE